MCFDQLGVKVCLIFFFLSLIFIPNKVNDNDFIPLLILLKSNLLCTN